MSTLINSRHLILVVCSFLLSMSVFSQSKEQAFETEKQKLYERTGTFMLELLNDPVYTDPNTGQTAKRKIIQAKVKEALHKFKYGWRDIDINKLGIFPDKAGNAVLTKIDIADMRDPNRPRGFYKLNKYFDFMAYHTINELKSHINNNNSAKAVGKKTIKYACASGGIKVTVNENRDYSGLSCKQYREAFPSAHIVLMQYDPIYQSGGEWVKKEMMTNVLEWALDGLLGSSGGCYPTSRYTINPEKVTADPAQSVEAECLELIRKTERRAEKPNLRIARLLIEYAFLTGAIVDVNNQGTEVYGDGNAAEYEFSSIAVSVL